MTTPNRQLTIESIQQTASEQWNVTLQHMKGTRGGKRVCEARMVAMYLIRELTEEKVSAVGLAFNRHHTSVSHAHNVIGFDVDMGTKLGMRVRHLRSELEQVMKPKAISLPDPVSFL